MKTKCWLGLAALVLTAWSAMSAEVRIAVFNLEEVFQKYYKTTLAEGFIQRQGNEFQSHMNKLNEELSALDAEFKVLRDASQNIALDPVEREKKRQEAERKSRDIIQKRTDIDSYGQEKNRKLQELVQLRRGEIFEDITAEVRRVATLEGYTVVLDSSARSGIIEMPTVVYFNPSLDITERIVTELNRNNQMAVVAQQNKAPEAVEKAAEETSQD